eukprot:CAMPEP_0197836864 /NCGR_PEP_ID=MMETSP1437-20131217/30318_1 /TAXON_ID=49252 ORGANISM="Eucampia antarctica, Strain CCMP1452" /NCGR_SAMPLE_ID=MMETSP1437 /ASSEMBLY_ACC=CAM_ASM_001096 /LENGTH=733 /DNA_ID=CAMNT_0043443399 /DNA_START=52 /DNA_END=2253 /DNA_ORIENTATION=+
MTSQEDSSLLDPNDTFATLCTSIGLDVRLRKGLARLGYVRPTLVQSKCLPLAITSGRDLLVRARTGSGKTLAYSLPLLHKILTKKSKDQEDEHDFMLDSEQNVGAIVLVPTRELCSQVQKTIQSLIYYCDEVIKIAVLSSSIAPVGSKKGSHHQEGVLLQQEAMLRDRPDIIVSTPAGLLSHIRNSGQSGLNSQSLKKSVQTLVVDEADLVLSFGYAKDITEITKSLPNICQGFLMSATLSPELNSLKRVVLHSPAVLKLEEEDERAAGRNKKDGNLMQFFLRLPKKDKNLVLYVFLKLGLLKGKGLFFVNTTDGGYRLKLFLEQFHIRSAVLNAELPLHSRLNIIKQFNVGNFDYLIATDESSDVTAGADVDEDDSDEDMEGNNDDEQQKKKSKRKKKRQKQSKKKDSEYGVSRGLDFRGVSFVVNVDFPPSCQSYTHRIGRTARGGASGVALSLVNMDDTEQESMLSRVQESQPPLPLAGTSGNETLQAAPEIGTDEDDSGQMRHAQQQVQPTPLDFDLAEIEGFRYRVEDVSRAVTKVAIKETRAAELRAEILNSQRLHSHFEENPSDLQLLRHDRLATHVSKVQDHLRNVPSYLLPRGMQVAEKKKKRKRRSNRRRDGTRRTENDPLHSHDGSGVTLDGVATAEGEQTVTGGDETKDMDDSEYFDDGLGNDSDDGADDDNKKQKTDSESYEGLGKSTAGRNKWKERHNKGEYSNKSRTGKKQGDGQFFT